VAVLAVSAAAVGIHLLPLLLGLYVLAVGSEVLLGWLTKRWLVEELESLRRAADMEPPPSSPPLVALASLMWQTVVDTVWAVGDRLVVAPILRRREQRGDFSYQGRHHADRWARHEIDGTVAQRRPSAAAQQKLVAQIVRADTGEQPVIDDTDIHLWLESAKQHQAVT